MKRRSSSTGTDMAKGLTQASWGLSVALGFAVIVVASWLVGRFLDDWLGSDPWLQVVGAVIGWVAGTVVVYYAAQRRLD
jgi:F0F1-type ATP synthase assembly protein I